MSGRMAPWWPAGAPAGTTPGRVTRAGSRWRWPRPGTRRWPTGSSASCSGCSRATGSGRPGTCPTARVRCSTAGLPSWTRTAGFRGRSGPGPPPSRWHRAAERVASSRSCGRWSSGPPTPPIGRWPGTACPVRPWITGRIRSRSRSVPPPRCWPACARPPPWPPTSAVRPPPAMATAGRPRRPGWPGRSRRGSAAPVTSAIRWPARVPTRPSRSSGRRSRSRALGCCGRPGQRSRPSPSPTAAWLPARRGPVRPTSPGPRRPRSSPCSTPRPGSTARPRRCWTGSPPTGRRSVPCPSR